MPSATKSRRHPHGGGRITDQFREAAEARRLQAETEVEAAVPAMHANGVDAKSLAKLEPIMQRADVTIEDLQADIATYELRKPLAGRRVAVDRELIKALSEQASQIEDEKAAAIAAFDQRLAPIQLELNKLNRDYGRAQEAEFRLLETCKPWVRSLIDAARKKVSDLERRKRMSQPVMGEDFVHWNDESRQWEPIAPGDAKHEKSARDFNARALEHREFVEAQEPEIEAAKIRLKKLLELAYQPWPTRADLAAIDAE